MPSAAMRRRVEAIPGTPLPHGLLSGSCVTQIESTDPHDLLGVEWLSLGCCDAGAGTFTWCDDEDSPDESPGDESPGEESPGETGVKTFCRPDLETADPVTVYSGAVCSAPGFTRDDAIEQARQSLILGREAALEDWFQSGVLCQGGVDLTPTGGALSVAQGVGLLEGWLARTYGGVGVLHLPTTVGALLGCCQIAHREGARLRTLTGNCVILGAGYDRANVGPGCTPAPDGEAWLWITGAMVIRREAVHVVPETDAEQVEIRMNDRRVLAEQTYVVQHTCRAAGVRVEVCT